MNYQKFAHVYDQVMDQQLYEEWTDYAVRSFSHSAKRPVRKVMELACGQVKYRCVLTIKDTKSLVLIYPRIC